MKKIIIIDDELYCIEVLEEMIKTHCRSLQIIGTARSGAQGLELVKELKPDLVFLDIEMPIMGGFEMLEKLLPLQFDVIFTTAYDNHAIRAFKYSALDYLLKPIDVTDLVTSVNKYIDSTTKTDYTAQLGLLKENIRYINPSHIQRIAIPTVDALIMQPVNDILYCEANSSYTCFHLGNNSKITSAKTLKEYEEILELHGFFRVHNSHLVNLNYVDKYIKGDGGFVIINGNIEIPVSRSRKEALVQKLQSL